MGVHPSTQSKKIEVVFLLLALGALGKVAENPGLPPIVGLDLHQGIDGAGLLPGNERIIHLRGGTLIIRL